MSVEVLRGMSYYQDFSRVFDAFKLVDEVRAEEGAGTKQSASRGQRVFAVPTEEGEQMDEQKEGEVLSHYTIAQLKQLVERPDVKVHAATPKEPQVSSHLKTYLNSTPAPCLGIFKKKYLQGQDVENPAVDQPEPTKNTETLSTEDWKTSMYQTVREIDVDYQKLHNAFHRWQARPILTLSGDLYVEGKELEAKLLDTKPGVISDDMRTALGLPVGDGTEMVQPPWLIALERYGCDTSDPEQLEPLAKRKEIGNLC